MTREEAIKMLNFLAIDTTGNLAGEQGDDAEFLVRVVDALDMAIAALREQCNIATNLQPEANSCKWISVEDRLPDDSFLEKEIIICILNRFGERRVDTKKFLGVHSALWNNDITHWMPLPKPPKED